MMTGGFFFGRGVFPLLPSGIGPDQLPVRWIIGPRFDPTGRGGRVVGLWRQQQWRLRRWIQRRRIRRWR